MIYYCMVDLFLPLDQIDLLSQLDFQNQSILEVVFILEIVNFCGTEGQAVFFPVNLWTQFTGNGLSHRKFHKIFHKY